jgi:hypothetical protein
MREQAVISGCGKECHCGRSDDILYMKLIRVIPIKAFMEPDKGAIQRITEFYRLR